MSVDKPLSTHCLHYNGSLQPMQEFNPSPYLNVEHRSKDYTSHPKTLTMTKFKYARTYPGLKEIHIFANYMINNRGSSSQCYKKLLI